MQGASALPSDWEDFSVPGLPGLHGISMDHAQDFILWHSGLVEDGLRVGGFQILARMTKIKRPKQRIFGYFFLGEMLSTVD